MRVKEVMDQKWPSIYENELATKARAIIREFDLRILPVVDKNKRLLGKVSRRDILSITSSVSPITVKGIMTAAKYVATFEDEATSTFKALVKADAWYAPVVTSNQDKTYRGVVGLESFIEPLMRTNPEKFLKEASEIMTREVVACQPDDEVDDIWRLMQETRFAGLPVTKNGKLVGIVTQKDLVESGAAMPTFESTKGRFRSSPKISSIMKTNMVVARPTTRIIKIARIMVSKDLGRIPVTDKDGKLVGIIDREDIAKQVIK